MTCTKSDAEVPSECIKVKMLGYLCGQANFQILDAAHYDKGEEGWQDGDKKLDHVFKAILTCSDMQLLDAMARPSYVGLEFKINILEKQEDAGCAVCKALLYGPNTWYYIKIQSNCK